MHLAALLKEKLTPRFYQGSMLLSASVSSPSCGGLEPSFYMLVDDNIPRLVSDSTYFMYNLDII